MAIHTNTAEIEATEIPLEHLDGMLSALDDAVAGVAKRNRWEEIFLYEFHPGCGVDDFNRWAEGIRFLPDGIIYYPTEHPEETRRYFIPIEWGGDTFTLDV